jgi:outer membrane murein-binding lipoprotein Lpp
MVFICKRCDQEFLHKAYLKSHLERKKICNFIDNDYDVKLLLEELYKRNLKEKTYDCEYCGMKFNSTSGKCQHKKICKDKPKDTETIVNELSEQVKKLQSKIEVLQIPLNNTETIINELSEQVKKLQSKIEVLQIPLNNDKINLDLQYYKNRRNEKFYQLLLENYLSGTHKTLSCGITDVTTDTSHAEIKEWSSWKEAIGQLTCYNTVDPKETLEMYMFGKYKQSCKDEAIKVTTSCKINIYEFVDTIEGVSIISLKNNEEIYKYKPE